MNIVPSKHEVIRYLESLIADLRQPESEVYEATVTHFGSTIRDREFQENRHVATGRRALRIVWYAPLEKREGLP